MGDASNRFQRALDRAALEKAIAFRTRSALSGRVGEGTTLPSAANGGGEDEEMDNG